MSSVYRAVGNLCAGAAYVCLSITLGAAPFEEGNALFKAGQFSEAEVAYSRSLAQDGDSADTRYNLGKVREALGDPARAMLEWERALRLDSKHVPSQKALEATRITMNSKVAAPSWWQKMQPDFTQRREVWVAALGVWILTTGIVGWWISRWRLEAGVLAVFGAIVGIAGFGWMNHADRERNIALILDRSVTLRAAPANPARELDLLPCGSRLQILDESGGWKYGKTGEGKFGWVPSKSVELISP